MERTELKSSDFDSVRLCLAATLGRKGQGEKILFGQLTSRVVLCDIWFLTTAAKDDTINVRVKATSGVILTLG